MSDEHELLLLYLFVVFTGPISNNFTEPNSKMEFKLFKEFSLLFFLQLTNEFTCTVPANTTTENKREHY